MVTAGYRAEKYVDSVCLIITCRNQNQVEKLYGREIGIYLISYVCLLRFLLALNFGFSKTKMFKLLFILLSMIGQLNIGYRCLLSEAKYYSTRESWVVVIQIETLHTLSVLIVACFYVCEKKKIVFREYLFLRMASENTETKVFVFSVEGF